MLKSFKTELEARERCFHMQSNQKEKHRSKFTTKQEQSTMSLLAQRVEQPTITCSYCHCLGKHTAGRCNIVTSVGVSNQYLQVAMEQYPYLVNLELAERASNSQEENDIPNGADYFLDLYD